MKARIAKQSGFTLAELLVSLSIFSLLGMSFVTFSTSALQRLSVENRISSASQELMNGLELLSSELRMSSSVSPYLVGTTATVVTCGSALSVTTTKVKFLVVQDENVASTWGLQPYYVGYYYNSATKQLLRGEIAGASITNCTLPAGDPTGVTYAKVLAENVVQIDADGNGTLDPVFSTSGNSIVVNLGVQITGVKNTVVTQKMPTTIYRRVS